MLTERATYNELEPILRRVMGKNPYAFSNMRGRIERACLKGEREFFFFIKPKGINYKVFYRLDLNLKLHSAGLVIEGCDGDSFAFPANGLEVIFIVRGHALKRYIQRKIYHDETHEATEEEITDALQRLSTYICHCCINYDKIGDQYHLGFDGGVFICTDNNKVVTLQTYLPVSMLKINQSISYRHTIKETQEWKLSMTDDDIKRRARVEGLMAAKKC